MNQIKKLYCRTFQTVFKLAMPILPYRNPKVLQSVSQVPATLQSKGINRVLIVTDDAIHKLGLIEPLKAELTKEHIDYVVYDKTVPNPTVKNVEEARQMYLEHKCQGLIGFGGGSAIDCAKTVGARIARPKKSIQKMEGILQVMRPIPYLVAIPTTAGTGSETTLATVITDGASGHKFPISDFFLIPNVAVLDPEITKSMPQSMTSTTGMDALTHAVEAYIGRSTTASTRADALKTVRLIADNLQKVYQNGNDTEGRANMLQAAFFAGRAFSKSYVGYCHAVAHSLGGKYKIPHGYANAVLLPYVLEAYGETIYKKGKELAIAMNLAHESTSEKEATERFITWMKETNKAMNIPNKLSGIRKEDIAELARYADKEANPLYPVPVLMDAQELQQLYYDVMEE